MKGARILLTRAERDGQAWARSMQKQGYEVEVLPCLRCEVLDDDATRQALDTACRQASWSAWTSPRAIDAFSCLFPVRTRELPNIAVVGPTTEARALEVFGRVDFRPPNATAADLARHLADHLDTENTPTPKVLFPCSDLAGRDLETILSERGIAVLRVPVYRTVPSPRSDNPVDLKPLRLDGIFLASPSAAIGFEHRVRAYDADVITIGPTTTAKAKDLGIPVAAEAPQPTLEGMLEAFHERRRRHPSGT